MSLTNKLLGVFVALALALGAVVLVAVLANASTTVGAREIEAEFAERVATDQALVDATEDIRRVEAQLAARTPASQARLDRAVVDSGRLLAADIAKALYGGNGIKAPERLLVTQLNEAYTRYLIVRRQTANQQDLTTARSELERAFIPLQSKLVAYATTHYTEAQRGLDGLQSAARGRRIVLAAAGFVAVVGLLAVCLMLFGFTRRVRDYVTFTARVAEGDLAVRVPPHGSDELATLAGGLNTMAAQLEASAQDRALRTRRMHDYRAAQAEFGDQLQAARSEAEAHALLRAHLERGVPAGGVAVLTRGSDDNLEAATPLPQAWELDERLSATDARSCLSVRLGKAHTAGDAAPALIACEICGGLAPNTTCVPLPVGGEVVGTVLIGHPGPLEDEARRRVDDSIAHAGPVLANLRNLSAAESQAATDVLTRLPNRRGFQDGFVRMLAQAGRTASPLSIVALDLDHFKSINDRYGHDRGDAVLAAVADVLTTTIRASDLAARTGGEEFVLLLPDTATDGAVRVAEKVRGRIANLAGLMLDAGVSASFGVATYPDHGTDGSTLLRLADRALYAAKAAGRDRVEITAEPSRGTGVDRSA